MFLITIQNYIRPEKSFSENENDRAINCIMRVMEYINMRSKHYTDCPLFAILSIFIIIIKLSINGF